MTGNQEPPGRPDPRFPNVVHIRRRSDRVTPEPDSGYGRFPDPPEWPESPEKQAEIVGMIKSYMDDLDTNQGVISERDRFGAALYGAMELLTGIAGDVNEEGGKPIAITKLLGRVGIGDKKKVQDPGSKIAAFVEQEFGPNSADPKVGTKARHRYLKAKRAAYSLVVMRDCIIVMRDADDNASIIEVVETITKEHPSFLFSDESGESNAYLVEQVVQDVVQLIDTLNPPSTAQDNEGFINTLMEEICVTSRKPMLMDPGSLERMMKGGYDEEAWTAYFDSNPTGSTDGPPNN